MKVVFLDIDGVLNDKTWVYGDRSSRERELFEYPAPEWYAGHLDPVKVERLNRVLAATGAKVVVSSTWRIGNTIPELQETLAVKGFSGQIIDFTSTGASDWLPNGLGVYPSRGERILTWISENADVEAFVILEDDVDPDMPEDRTVKTWYSEEGGLQEDDVGKAINILETPL